MRSPTHPFDARCAISDILCAVRNTLSARTLFAIALACLFVNVCAASAQQAPPPSLASPGLVIVLDPAHGGTDTGARGETSVEKDVVLQIARTVRTELERQGYRVVMTRNDDSYVSYDDRAAVANAHPEAVFISLHVSSTGTSGTARVYYHQLAAPIPPAPGTTAANAKSQAPPATGLTVWEEAQRPYSDASHRLADLIQSGLAQVFSGSPVTASGAAVRGLRSVAAPAVAIEVSSVSVSSADSLIATAAPLANAIAQAVGAFRQTSSSGAR
ncbi:MAG: N-acetylmuramoyl-L-alanine amidase [Acidobacteriia bacterium]|nr:N-acetylmuramoyl-L-alanine amidase [Terriglobia bacterium]